jgi:serine/threonine protein kinase
MSKEPEVAGEGTYGCVHTPSLECSVPNINYKNKASKILEEKHAVKELDEYLGIQRADPYNKFFLGIPLHCKPKQTVSNYNAIKKCKMGKAAISDSPKQIHPDFDLLIMENGGVNLKTFADEMFIKPVTSKNCKIMEKFWIECHRLFLGLAVFLKENIMHHDLKAQNIVYNPETNRIAFIDFGLMCPLDTEKSKILKGKNTKNLMHWSYPVESMLYEKTFYESIKIKKQIINNLKAHGIQTAYDSAFLNNVLPFSNTGDDLVKRKLIEGFLYYSMIDVIKSTSTISHEDFVNKSVRTFDLYGMAMGLMYVFNRTFHLLKGSKSKIDYRELFKHLVNCFRPDSNRYTVMLALRYYEDVLADILREDHIIFINHVPTKVDPPPHLSVPKISDAVLEKTMEEKDEKLRKKICPAGKTLNPFTGRCVKECKAGQMRDANFKCKSVKNQPAQSNQSKTRKSLPKSPTVLTGSPSIVRLSPEKSLSKSGEKLVIDDIKQIVYHLVHNNDKFAGLITKQLNIKDDAAELLLRFINSKTPRKYREILTRIDLLQTYETEVKTDTDNELLLWIVNEIIELVLNRVRDMGKMIITKNIMENFIKTSDFIKLLEN